MKKNIQIKNLPFLRIIYTAKTYALVSKIKNLNAFNVK